MSLPYSKKKRSKSKIKRTRNSGLNSSATEVKLSRIAIHYEYLFEWDVNFKDRIIVVAEDISALLFSRIDAAMTEMESESRKAITIRINSFGGSVYDALAIVGRLRKAKLRGIQIITEGYGAIMSAATLILAAGDKRRVYDPCWFMHHEMSIDPGDLKASELRALAHQTDKESKQWASWMEKFTGRPAKFWLEKGTHIDAYFDASQLVKLGVADEVI